MAHFAKIGLNSKVIEVIKVNNEVLKDADGVEQESIGIDFLTKLTGYPVWKQTSYNSNFRKNYAGKGYIYDEDREAFYLPKPYPSWILNETTCQWEAPIARPTDQLESDQWYEWNEESNSWIIKSKTE
jgi:hypothetical protein|tara:strand:- start:714 stop:1097 length:384 start_codon:yes stop_codon:yes gene_type:complete